MASGRDVREDRRPDQAAGRLQRKLLKTQGMAPEELVTDRLRAYGAAARELGLGAEHIQSKRKNNQAESHRQLRAEAFVAWREDAELAA
jgi:putative transposase